MATSIVAGTATSITAGVKGARQFQGLFDAIPFKCVITEDSIAATSASNTDFTVPGAEVGDFVLVSTTADNQLFQLIAGVSAADTVTINAISLEATDAVTALASGINVNGVVLKPKKNVLDFYTS